MSGPINRTSSSDALPPVLPGVVLRDRAVTASGHKYRHKHEIELADGKVVKCFVASEVSKMAGNTLKRAGYVRVKVIDSRTNQPFDILVKKKKLIGLGIDRAQTRGSGTAGRELTNYQTRAKQINYLTALGFNEMALKSMSSDELQSTYEGRLESQYVDEIAANSPGELPDLSGLNSNELKHLSYSLRYAAGKLTKEERYEAGKLTADEVAAMPNKERSNYLAATVNKVPSKVVVEHVYHRDPEAAASHLTPVTPPGWDAALSAYQPMTDKQRDKDLERSKSQVGNKVIEKVVVDGTVVKTKAEATRESINDLVNIGMLSKDQKGYLSTFIVDNLCETNTATQAQGAVYEAYGVPGGAVTITPGTHEEFWLPTEERATLLQPMTKTVEITDQGKIRITVSLLYDVNKTINMMDDDPEANRDVTYARVQTTSVIECTPEEIIAWKGDASQCTPKVTVTRIEPPSTTPVENHLARAA